MFKKWLHFIFMGLIALSLSGCELWTTYYQAVGRVDTLSDLQKLHAISRFSNPNPSEHLGTEALKDVALSVGAQAGLAFRANQINQARLHSEKALERIFNFNLLILPHNVLPPVLVQGENALNLADAQTLRISDRTYQIVRQAHFVSVPPTWRDYLWMHYEFPDKPVPAFLPKTQEEQTIWKEAVKEGWNQGVAQAESIDTENLARLKRDYLGMVLYRKLLKQGMVSEPYVAHTNLGVTGDQETIRIHDQILRITALPELRPDYHSWKPIITSQKT
jgi:defect-in-organelle-trafficking protein DotC